MIKENDIQRAVASYLDGVGVYTRQLFFFHPPNSIYTSKAQAGKHKAYGMKAGIPDCVIFLAEGKALFIEIKTKRGYLSQNQKKVHGVLEGLGHSVYTVKAASTSDAVNQVQDILKSHGVRV